MATTRNRDPPESPSSVDVKPLPSVNPNILQLENKPKATLAHDHGAGSPCLKCKDDCPGLDLHFWRKICKVCKCRKEEHDIPTGGIDPGRLRIGKLFDSPIVHQLDSQLYIVPPHQHATITEELSPGGGLHNALQRSPVATYINQMSNTGPNPVDQKTHQKRNQGQNQGQQASAKDRSVASNIPPNSAPQLSHKSSSVDTNNRSKVTETTTICQTQTSEVKQLKQQRYSWVPPAPNPMLVSKYMQSIPEEERPITGTIGAKKRERDLNYQFPWHDLDETRSNGRKLTAEELDQFERYMLLARQSHAGQAMLKSISSSKYDKNGGSEDSGTVSSVGTGGGDTDGDDGESWPPPPTLDELEGNFKHSMTINDGGKKSCAECKENMSLPGEVCLTTQHSGPQTVWHPNCFVCCQCKQRLVDMLYFYRDGSYYCGRHFGDTMFPRCKGCDELIFAREYTRAEEANWHLNHFCCFGCDAELGGQRYMERGGNPYCIPCYMNEFARECAKCNKKIAPDCKRISHKNLHWHALPECFHCVQCESVLLGKKFVLREGNLFCSGQCKDSFSNRPSSQRAY